MNKRKINYCVSRLQHGMRAFYNFMVNTISEESKHRKLK